MSVDSMHGFGIIGNAVPKKRVGTFPKVSTESSALAVERALLILHHLAQAPGGVGVRDLARRFGYGLNVTQKTLNALRTHEFVRQQDGGGKYVLGFRVVELAMAMLSHIDVRAVAHPHLRTLSERIQESVYLGQRDGDEVVYVDRAEPSGEMRVSADVGTRRPLNCTAVGKALLAFLADPPLEALFARGALKGPTPNSLTDLPRLKKELDEVHQLGYAVDREEFMLGVGCVAAPVFDHTGTVKAAVTTATLAARLNPERLAQVAGEVKATAAAISRALGFLTP
jgi:DNA-binding IclR family transcriptional regulator